MLAVLMQHYRPDSVANAFTSLLSLFNDVQGSKESVLQYPSRFDGIVMDLSQRKVAIPQILMVMLFLCAIHSRYSDLLEQFCTRFRCIKMATLDSIVKDIKFHDGFTVHECKGGAEPLFLMLLRLLRVPTRTRRVRSGRHHLSGSPRQRKKLLQVAGRAPSLALEYAPYAIARPSSGMFPTSAHCLRS
jgi:hypothetical protein